jgi:hypothetical protein
VVYFPDLKNKLQMDRLLVVAAVHEVTEFQSTKLELDLEG